LVSQVLKVISAVAGAVNFHHTDLPPKFVAPEDEWFGSPGSLLAPALVPTTVCSA
jgi:hypothetical protein